VLAQRILDYRDQHGGFATVADLQKVSGIGESRYNDLKNRVTV
jgi:competence protein ComEA